MGLAEEAIGNGEGLGRLPRLGVKQKYIRMDAQIPEETTGEENPNGRKDDSDRIKQSRRYVIACAVFASLNSVLLGYDVGVMSGCILFIQKDLHINEVQQEVLVGCLSFISLVGSLAAGRTSDAIGRKWTIALAAVIFQAGAAVMTFAPSFTVLMVGRLLAGVGIGFSIMIAPVYIAEISPAVTRGSLSSFPEIFINVGILLGYISNYAFSGLSNHINWRVMLAVGILPSVFIGFALLVIPESPRWLVLQNRADEARSVLVKIVGTEEEATERLAEIETAALTATAGKLESAKPVWSEILNPSPVLRRMLITGLGIQCFQQITGIDATVYYSPTILRTAGIKSDNKLLAATIAVGFTKTVFILIAILLIDLVGRKPLLYVSTIGMTICLFGLAASLSLLDKGLVSTPAGIAVAMVTVCGNVAFFSVGMGPISWVMGSEIFPLRVRAQAAALGTVANRVSSGLVAMSFLSICNAISVGGTFFIFGVLSALSVAFMYRFVPETRGKNLEQIEALFGDEGEWEGKEMELSNVKYEGIVNK
ncbi:Major facilitator superfamily protein [Rhynchospora pubera]|uniref:Major facilitator superfamily protein n=1 Tax=Rhynchospora pubera TaxID=906938 RepID=A0AAV8EYD8_9POAL|nr:Major facilitator superfamily protein [Rhynchospora pubera]